jgi:hypothetical protein
MTQENNKLIPSANMHLKNINTNMIFESVIYLGKYDNKSNYVEVSESEYQDYLKKESEITYGE